MSNVQLLGDLAWYLFMDNGVYTRVKTKMEPKEVVLTESM